ncbi:MAG: molecular chaperone HtpG [Candidatus Brocadia sp. AMX2]|uniref:Chaperone protein HtpG n=1 Tax=Candidatus Brocadia sinica JPN1 TaxID=1197129 RepID=A0ABQ0JXR5_9BACT|nr:MULTISPECIES: molecular chaperone HtpG [Brocadia]MBC6933794.1 molecular chaperone HtpG [Candidatus Brocadia sp.]MBL1170529.1 molecular chaperone HtpG [Candidatus Brocadia sp. AMX1]NOG40743.1 molecular chaperone HtpG [Planctomycetota bacterium]GIK13284.1 MAG: molecular chaperone HtpG [Candidatus Brocadia sinica]KAA0242730.1 MAG: molecular chaperone HtpG [Candidatus Brocadia sp. AMX2]
MTEKMKHEEGFEFQAEIKKLLNILSHSLYTHKEVFLRELISNASDALTKIRYYSLTNPDYEGKDLPLEININVDEKSKILTISDTGIGMTKDEIIQNVGTIAKSGSLDFIANLSEQAKKDSNIIGQFGVGFYSVFMVADEVRIRTKSYKKDEPAFEWHSDGTGKYFLNPIEKERRGTDIVVHLKDDEKEYTEKSRIQSIIKKYSNFVSFPIMVCGERANQITAIWKEPKKNITEEQYNEFYKFISNTEDIPLFRLHTSAEAPIQFSSIVYCPSTNYETYGFKKLEHGLQLYSNKILIQSDCKLLLPEYLRFVRGVVDSADIPLNISRETFQDNRIIHKMKSILVKQIITLLQDLAKNEKEKYETFWRQFGRILKEGVHFDFENRDQLSHLLRFNSSTCTDASGLISLKEYIDRMKPEQKEIYYITAVNRETIEKSPYLEIFRKKDVEVLYLTDPNDEFILSGLHEFEKKPIRSADQANLDLLKDTEKKIVDTSEEPQNYEAIFKHLLKTIKVTLADKVIDVKESNRLVDSPCCLVNPDGVPSVHVQKLIQMVDGNYKISKKIMEINRKNRMIQNLARMNENPSYQLLIEKMVQQLFENALMQDGVVFDPTAMVPRLNELMEELTKAVLGEGKRIII